MSIYSTKISNLTVFFTNKFKNTISCSFPSDVSHFRVKRLKSKPLIVYDMLNYEIVGQTAVLV